MTLPNRITLARISSLPFIIFLLYSRSTKWYTVGYVLAWVFCLTDYLDGYLARKLQQVSLLGKILDPIADKLVVLLIGVLFVDLRLLPAWVLILIVLRELVISDFRLFALQKGREVAVSKGGKWKATCQFFLLAILGYKQLLVLRGNGVVMWVEIVYWIVLITTLVLTLLSLIEYFWTNRLVLAENDQSCASSPVN